MKSSKLITVLLVSLMSLCTIGVIGQEIDSVNHEIKLITKSKGGDNILRWGFPSALSWKSAIKSGVEVYKIELAKDGAIPTKVATVFPLSTVEIESLARKQSQSEALLALVNQQVHLDWENSLYTGNEDILEKADNFNNRWSMVHLAADKNKYAAIAAGLRYEDVNVDPTKKYAYKVVVKGKYPSSDLSSVFPGYVHVPLIYDIEEKEQEILLKWDREAHEDRYTSYYIERSRNGKSFERINELPFAQMFDPSVSRKVTHFTYPTASENNVKYHYRLIGLDAFGDESLPSPVYIASGVDRTPPVKPKMKFVKNREHLKIGLEWEQESPEEVHGYLLEGDIDGRKVIIDNFARSNERKKTFEVERRGIHSMRLIAIDKNGNAAYSDTYFADAIDTKAPDAPGGLDAECDSNGVVTLVWDQPLENDIVGYYIFSSDSESRTFQGLNGLSHPVRIYKDTLSLSMMNEKKLYKIVAIDSDGMRSKFSEQIEVKIPDNTPPSPALIEDYKVESDYIQIKLRPSSSRDVVAHIIERKSDDAKWEVIYDGQPDRPIFRDSLIDNDVKYAYRFYAIDDAGLKSKIVDELNVRSKRKSEYDLNFSAELIDGKVVVTWPTKNHFKKIKLYKKTNGEVSRRDFTNLTSQFIDNNTKSDTIIEYRIKGVFADGKETGISKAIEITVL